MKRNRPPSPETRRVLAALAAAGRGWTHGYDMIKATGLKSGSLYPILMRLEDRGLLEAQWQDPVKPGRPPRHAYRLTGAGHAVMRELAAADAPAAPAGPASDGGVLA